MNEWVCHVYGWRLRFVVLLACCGVHAGALAESLPRLPGLGAQGDTVTVSGLSAGGAMATQFHLAHSATVRGAAIIAGIPYYCARYSALRATTACMSPNMLARLPSVMTLVAEVDKQAAAHAIDTPAHLADSRVWLGVGSRDEVVKAEVVELAAGFYRHWLPAAAVRFETIPEAGHAMVTPDGGHACAETRTPFINQCGSFDTPGRLLAWLLGELKPKAEQANGELRVFDQGEFTRGERSVGMGDKGWVYLPQSCLGGGCRVHVAFHGCQQNDEAIDDAYVRTAGYNAWAESNRLIVLYPQTRRSLTNPGACWDWWGYTGPDYHTRNAPQIRAVQAMIERLAGK
ncbi:depolymerase [Betaproteobacteria bacterium]|nr:depolymerase [Betaproteobacteria bacterium]